MISLLIYLFILGLLIIVHEFGHFIAALAVGVRVEKFSIGFGKQLFKKKRGLTEYCVGAIPLGGYVKLAGDNMEEYKGQSDEYFTKPARKRFQIIFFGPLLNYILGFLCFWLIFFVGYPAPTTKVGGLVDGFGAKEAGVEVGDRITAVDEKKVMFWEDLQRIIQAKKGATKVRLSFLRNNKEQEFEVLIKEKPLDDELGQRRNVGLLGITPSDETMKLKYGFFKSFYWGLNKTWGLTEVTIKGLWRLITGKLSIRETVTGPLGIFDITSKAVRLGAVAVLHIIGILSISLAIFNLLPLPVLDGGHILFLGIEKLRGRTLSVKTERIISQIGLTLLICLAVLVTYNDILRLFGDKIAKLFK